MPNHQPALVQQPLNNPPTPIEDPQPTPYLDEPVDEPLDNSYTDHQDMVEPEQSVSSEPGNRVCIHASKSQMFFNYFANCVR